MKQRIPSLDEFINESSITFYKEKELDAMSIEKIKDIQEIIDEEIYIVTDKISNARSQSAIDSLEKKLSKLNDYQGLLSDVADKK
ncbi:MAG: hypothetical protein WC979_01990 [Candidatus Pacearchaeota archaeon]|jgi:polyhydroxyalkanoate synthesis regulator phasin|nr:hypothetical protein [Clostridia bacterium]